MKKLFLTFLLFSSHAFCEMQLEARIPLSASNFNKLKKAFPHKYKNRSDFYFDIYDGKQFVLSEKLPELKLRIKNKDNSDQLQIAIKKQEASEFQCQGLTIYSGRKETYETELNSDDILEINKISNQALSLLKNNNSKAINSFQALKKSLLYFISEGEDFLNLRIPNQLHYFVPTNNAVREKYEMSYHSFSKDIDLALKSSVVFDVLGKRYESFEIEAQPVHPEKFSEKELADSLCDFLKDHELDENELIQDSHPEIQASLNFYRTKNYVLKL